MIGEGSFFQNALMASAAASAVGAPAPAAPAQEPISTTRYLSVTETGPPTNGEDTVQPKLGPEQPRPCALVATGGADKKIKLWDLQTGEAVSTLEGHTHGIITSEPRMVLAAAGLPLG